MPVRSLTSSVLKWPDAHQVDVALRRWAVATVRRACSMASPPAAIWRIGYIGSYARGDWGVGSDVDILILLEDTALPFERRGELWDTSTLPVPAETHTYTRAEWAAMASQNRRFYREATRDVVWVYTRHRRKCSAEIF